jgi:hypothetical protein
VIAAITGFGVTALAGLRAMAASMTVACPNVG